ncbi:MAG: SCO family protein [Bdellovibrionota bacterium]
MTNTTSQTQEQVLNKLAAKSEITKIFESKLFWVALVLILFSLPLTLSLRRPPVPQPPVLGQLGAFSLINQEGLPFGTEQVMGSVLLVNFVFTRCPSVCPTLTKAMSQIQERLKGTAKSIQLLTITVDPDFDKPNVLKAYAKQFGARHDTWNFLTGSKEDIRKLVVDNFKSALEEPISEDKTDMAPAFEIAHSEQFVIVDQVGRIRAYEHVQSSDDINRILRLFAIIANTPPRS